MTWLDVLNGFDVVLKMLVLLGGSLCILATLFFLIYAAGTLLLRAMERLD